MRWSEIILKILLVVILKNVFNLKNILKKTSSRKYGQIDPYFPFVFKNR